MTDLSKLKRRGSLGAPPPIAEASTNLDAPELVPPARGESDPPPRQPTLERGAGGSGQDGRSARRTGRTLQFATRVSPEFDARVRAIASRDGLLLVEVLERALDAYEWT